MVNWQAVGAIGEIVGATAVVLSLVYLAMQIRQNTQLVEEQCRTQRQNSLLGARSAFTEWRSMVIQDSAIAAIWRKGSRSLELLDEDERIRMEFLLVDFFWAFATLWIQDSEGLGEQSLWNLSKGNIVQYADPGVRSWWFSTPRRNEFPDEFTKSVDRILRGGAPRTVHLTDLPLRPDRTRLPAARSAIMRPATSAPIVDPRETVA